MTMRKEQIEMRRAILLTVVGATPTESRTLKNIMEEGYLFTVKSWLEDILNGSVGKSYQVESHSGHVSLTPILSSGRINYVVFMSEKGLDVCHNHKTLSPFVDIRPSLGYSTCRCLCLLTTSQSHFQTDLKIPTSCTLSFFGIILLLITYHISMKTPPRLNLLVLSYLHYSIP